MPSSITDRRVPSLHGPALFQIPTDQRLLQDRHDILMFQTEPLVEWIEVAGDAEVELFASSSAEDTDFFARLIDVALDGLARDVSLGMARARYRDGLDRPQLIEPGRIVRYTIRMNPTSNAFLPGHRIRLDITSCDFANYDRNHNTAADQSADGEFIPARQSVYHGRRSASRINLPVVPPATGAKHVRLTHELASDAGQYVYFHLTTSDGNVAWSSPIWLPAAKIPQ